MALIPLTQFSGFQTQSAGVGGAISPAQASPETIPIPASRPVGTPVPRLIPLSAFRTPIQVGRQPMATQSPTSAEPPSDMFQDFRSARTGLGLAGTAATASKSFGGPSVNTAPLSAISGGLDLAMALADTTRPAVSRGFQGAGGAAQLASAAAQYGLIPDLTLKAATATTPAVSALGAVGPALGMASAIAGAAQKGPATQAQAIQMMGNALALGMLFTPAAPFAWIPALAGGAGGFLPGKDVHKTMLRHEAETQASQRAMASAFGQAKTPEDLVRAYTAISGTSATVEDLIDPARRATVFRFPLDAEVRTPFEMAVERVLPAARRTPAQVVDEIQDRLGLTITPEQAADATLSVSPAWLARDAQPADLLRIMPPGAGIPEAEAREFGPLGRRGWELANALAGVSNYHPELESGL